MYNAYNIYNIYDLYNTYGIYYILYIWIKKSEPLPGQNPHTDPFPSSPPWVLSLLASTINNHHLYIRKIIRWKIPDQIFETFASSDVQRWRLPVVVSLQTIEFQLHNINSKSLIYQNLKFQNLAHRVFNFNTAGPISSLKIPCSICPFNCTFYTIGALPEKINFNTISFLSLLPFEFIIWNYFLSSPLSLYPYLHFKYQNLQVTPRLHCCMVRRCAWKMFQRCLWWWWWWQKIISYYVFKWQ